MSFRILGERFITNVNGSGIDRVEYTPVSVMSATPKLTPLIKIYPPSISIDGQLDVRNIMQFLCTLRVRSDTTEPGVGGRT